MREIVRERTYTTFGGTVIPGEQVTYKITDVGIDRVEGESRFKKQSPFGGVHIGSVQGAVVFGDQNVVNNQFLPLAERLTQLEQAVSSTTMPEAEKVGVIADIETIKVQLAKASPDRGIIRHAWGAVAAAVTAHNFAEILVGTAEFIGPLIS